MKYATGSAAARSAGTRSTQPTAPAAAARSGGMRSHSQPTAPAADAEPSGGTRSTVSPAGTAAETGDASSYPGGKSGAGIPQRIISLIPPHDVLVVPFAGRCGITRRIRPAARTILVDLDPAVCDWWHKWQTTPKGRRVEIHCADGIEFLRHFCGLTRYTGDTSHTVPPIANGWPTPTCIFADPPYVLGARTGKIYRHELTDADHAKLVGTVTRIPAAQYSVILCGYWSPIYHRLDHWRRIEHQVMTRGGLRREQIWTNYAEPRALHDYRFIGTDRRERERIHRRQKTILATLATLPQFERAAMIAAIADHSQPGARAASSRGMRSHSEPPATGSAAASSRGATSR
jgi:DNA adenine methylase